MMLSSTMDLSSEGKFSADYAQSAANSSQSVESSELKPQSLLWDHYGSMSVRKEFVRLLASKVVNELVQQEMIGVPEGLDLTEPLYEVMEKETSLEDRLNEEVRLVLNQYQDQMRSSGASYQEMFKLIKNKLVKERKLVL